MIRHPGTGPRRPQLLALASLALAACAGGGGGGGGSGTIAAPVTAAPSPVIAQQPATPTLPGVTANDFRTFEYNRSWALEAASAAPAYARGYTGAGVVIGIVDFNFDLAQADIRFDPASRAAVAENAAMYEAQFGKRETAPHGGAVAAVAAAMKNDSGIHGIAFNATVLAVDFFSGVDEWQTRQGSTLYHVSDPWTYLTARGVRIINTSFGYDEGDAIATSLRGAAAPDADAVTVQALPPGVTRERYTLDDNYIAVARGALLVSSAGNDGEADPSQSNLDILNDLRSRNLLNGPGAFIIAGATDSNNQIASFSDRAGIAMDHYMVAPGSRLVGPWGSSLAIISGTSFSAPIISGAAAIVMERWPSLTARQVAEILFASATDLGAPGVDVIYGHGLLNVDAALQPVGVSTMAVSSGTAPTVASTGLILGSAFGDAPAFHSVLSEAVMLDGFGRDFTIDLRGMVQAGSSVSLAEMLARKFAPSYAGMALTPTLQFGFAGRSDPEDRFAGLGFNNGLAREVRPQGVFRFDGVGDGFTWSAGDGMSLSDALYGSSLSRFANPSLSQAFAGMNAAPATFATVTMPVAADTDLSFGAAEIRYPGFSNAALGRPANAHSAGVRIAHSAEGSDLGIEFAGLFERGTLLGSYSSGGLKLADHAATVWMTFSGETAIAPNWSLKGAFTLARTEASPASGSLIAELGPILSSSFSFGVMRENLFRGGDALSFTVSQPHRVEQAPVVLVLGIDRDADTGEVIMARERTSLIPTAREVALEGSYRTVSGPWRTEASIGYSFNAGHIAGRNEAKAMIFAKRFF